MNPLFGFVLENGIGNTAPIFVAIGIFATVFDSVVKRAPGVARAIIYAAVGTVAGLAAYAAYDIPDRSIELLEAVVLGIGMFIYALLACSLVIFIRSRVKQKNQRDDRLESA